MDVTTVDAMLDRCRECLDEHNSAVTDSICRHKIEVLTELRDRLVEQERPQ